jgi:hypothetical protein
MEFVTPELSAIVVQALVLIGQLMRQARRQKATQEDVADIRARVRSLPCVSITTPPPKPTFVDVDGLPVAGHPSYGCPIDR